MDLVIPLGKGSRWEDNELRYALRGIEKYISGIDRLFIVGMRPEWLTGDVIHLPFEDVPGGANRDTNIFGKIMTACRDERLSQNFLYASDDHFILSPAQADEYPYFCKGVLTDTVAGMPDSQPYKKVLSNTVDILSRRNDTIRDYQLHCPIVYDKSMFQRLKADFGPALAIQYGFAIKSVYCNHFNIPGVPYTDLKIKDPLSYQEIADAVENRAFFSIANRALSGGIKQFLQDIFPHKSKYEL